MVKSNKSICNFMMSTVQKDITFICWKLKGKSLFLLYFIWSKTYNVSVLQNINWIRIFAKSNRNILFKDSIMSIILSYNFLLSLLTNYSTYIVQSLVYSIYTTFNTEAHVMSKIAFHLFFIKKIDFFGVHRYKESKSSFLLDLISVVHIL